MAIQGCLTGQKIAKVRFGVLAFVIWAICCCCRQTLLALKKLHCQMQQHNSRKLAASQYRSCPYADAASDVCSALCSA
jgi:hypothetical protein